MNHLMSQNDWMQTKLVSHKDKIVVINPLVKKDIYKVNLSFKNINKLNLLVVGGSQGANIFDKNLKNSINKISKYYPIKIIQQTET